MRIVCPSCSAAYEVPDSLLGGAAPRKLRCARCSHDWMPPELQVAEKPEPVAAPFVAEAPAHVPVEMVPPPVAKAPVLNAAGPRLADIPARPAGLSGARLDIAAVAMTLLVIGGLGFGAYKYRADIMAAWPPSQRVYAALGLGI